MSHNSALEEMSIPTRSLVLGLVRADGELRADELYRVAGECGMSDQQVRLCLRRLVVEGALEHRGGRGRKAIFHAPAAKSTILPELDLLDFAYRQDAGKEPWDGIWRLVAFSVPEAQRSARDELRPFLLSTWGPRHCTPGCTPLPTTSVISSPPKPTASVWGTF